MVRNVAHNLRRSDRRRQAREQQAAVAPAVWSSAEWMDREERRHRLVELVDALPAEQRAVLLLRYFEALPPRRIATRLGVPVGTVWNLHRRALQRLGRDLGADARRDGIDRTAWLVPLIGRTPDTPSARPGPAPATPDQRTRMATEGKIACAAVVLLALAGYAVWESAAPPPHGTTPGAAVDALATTAIVSPTAPAAARTPSAPERNAIAAPPAPAPTTGSLVVRVGIGSAPAPDVAVHARRAGEDPRSAVRTVSNAQGIASFVGLPPGRLLVSGDRFDRARPVNVEAGERAELELVLPAGVTLRGRVVDEHGHGEDGVRWRRPPLGARGRRRALRDAGAPGGRLPTDGLGP